MITELPILAQGDASMAAALGLMLLIMFGIFLCIRSLFVLAGVMLASSRVLPKELRFSIKQGFVLSLAHSIVAGVALLLLMAIPEGTIDDIIKKYWILWPAWVALECVVFAHALKMFKGLKTSLAYSVSGAVHGFLALLCILISVFYLITAHHEGNKPANDPNEPEIMEVRVGGDVPVARKPAAKADSNSAIEADRKE